MAQNGGQTDASQTAAVEAGTSTPDACTARPGRRVAGKCAARLLPIPCGTGEQRDARAIPASALLAVVEGCRSPQREAHALGALLLTVRPLCALSPYRSSLPGCSL